MGEGEVEKTLHQLSPFFSSIFLLFPRNAWYSGYFYFPDSSQISAMVGDHSRQIENSNLYRQGRWRWISHITNPLNCWAPVPLSRKFQFLAHFPFPAKFIARIRGRIVAIGRYIWDGRQKLKAPIVWDFPDIWKLGFRETFTANGQHQISHDRKHASIISQQQSLYTELMWSF